MATIYRNHNLYLKLGECGLPSDVIREVNEEVHITTITKSNRCTDEDLVELKSINYDFIEMARRTYIRRVGPITLIKSDISEDMGKMSPDISRWVQGLSENLLDVSGAYKSNDTDYKSLKKPWGVSFRLKNCPPLYIPTQGIWERTKNITHMGLTKGFKTKVIFTEPAAGDGEITDMKDKTAQAVACLAEEKTQYEKVVLPLPKRVVFGCGLDEDVSVEPRNFRHVENIIRFTEKYGYEVQLEF